jgi:hypothetical protein
MNLVKEILDKKNSGFSLRQKTSEFNTSLRYIKRYNTELR